MLEKRKENRENNLKQLASYSLLDFINEEKKKEKENVIKTNLLNKDYVFNNNKKFINKLDLNIENLNKKELSEKKRIVLFRKNN